MFNDAYAPRIILDRSVQNLLKNFIVNKSHNDCSNNVFVGLRIHGTLDKIRILLQRFAESGGLVGPFAGHGQNLFCAFDGILQKRRHELLCPVLNTFYEAIVLLRVVVVRVIQGARGHGGLVNLRGQPRLA